MVRGFSIARGIVVMLVAASGWLVWRELFPSDEDRIRDRIAELEEIVNTKSTDGIGRLADAARLMSCVTEDVLIEPGAPYPPVRGRQALVAVLGRASDLGGFELSFEDVTVEVTHGRLRGASASPDVARRAKSGSEAVVRMTATLTWTNAQTGERTFDAREIEVDFREVDDEWQVSAGRAIQVLERPAR